MTHSCPISAFNAKFLLRACHQLESRRPLDRLIGKMKSVAAAGLLHAEALGRAGYACILSVSSPEEASEQTEKAVNAVNLSMRAFSALLDSRELTSVIEREESSELPLIESEPSIPTTTRQTPAEDPTNSSPLDDKVLEVIEVMTEEPSEPESARSNITDTIERSYIVIPPIRGIPAFPPLAPVASLSGASSFDELDTPPAEQLALASSNSYDNVGSLHSTTSATPTASSRTGSDHLVATNPNGQHVLADSSSYEEVSSQRPTTIAPTTDSDSTDSDRPVTTDLNGQHVLADSSSYEDVSSQRPTPTSTPPNTGSSGIDTARLGGEWRQVVDADLNAEDTPH